MTSPTSTSVPARSIIVAPRLPDRPKEHTGNPFTSEGLMTADCMVDGCTYHAVGPRADVKKAVDAHHKLYHSEQIGVVLLNQPGQ